MKSTSVLQLGVKNSAILFWTGGKQFRLEYKNFYSLDLAKDGTGQVYNTKTLDSIRNFLQ